MFKNFRRKYQGSQNQNEVTYMDFGNLGGMGAAAAAYIKTPEGQNTIKSFLASPDGISLLKNFLATEEGKQVIRTLLPQILDSLNLPQPVKEMIKSAVSAN